MVPRPTSIADEATEATPEDAALARWGLSQARAPRGLRGINSIWGHLATLGLTAILLGGAFPQPGWWLLAWFALVPMGVLIVRTGRPRRLAWTAFLVFVAWWLVRIRWMTPVTGGGYVGLSAVMALYWTLAVGALNLVHRKFRIPMIVALPVIWVTLEWLRGWFPQGGFGWYLIGHSQAPYTPDQAAGRILQTADLFGEWTVSFIVCVINGLLIDLLVRPWFRPITMTEQAAGETLVARGRRLRPTARYSLFAGAVVLSAAWWYGQFRLSQTARVARPGPVVGLVQTNVPEKNTHQPTPREEQARWRQMLKLTRDVADDSPRPSLIVWPETMVPASLNAKALAHYRTTRGGWAGAQIYDQQIRAMARRLNRYLLVGAPASSDFVSIRLPNGRSADIAKNRANSAYLYDPRGRQADQRYDKIHLVPFGEYLPWIDAVPWLKGLFLRYMSPWPFDYSIERGTKFTRFTMRVPIARGSPSPSGKHVHPPAERNAVPAVRRGHDPLPSDPTQTVRFGTPICFEDTDPRICQGLIYGKRGGIKKADMLINITDDGWFAHSAQPLQHMQIAAFRCVENRVPMGRAVNTGPSGFIDAAGRVGKMVSRDGRRVDMVGDVAAPVQLDPRRTLYSRMGQIPVGCLSLLALGLVLAAAFRPDVAAETAEPAKGSGKEGDKRG